MNRKMNLGAPTVEKLKDFQQGVAASPLYDMLGRIIEAPQAYASTDAILGEFRVTLGACKKFTLEEKHELCTALETVMDLLKMEGSDGMLENWLHGILL